MSAWMNMWRTVNPSPNEIEAAQAAFDGVDVTDIVPRLVMVRRAVAAEYYTDTLPRRARLRAIRPTSERPTSHLRLVPPPLSAA